MKCSDDTLFTPLYLKLENDMPWPEEEKAFYLLAREGLFFCRNHPFFKSCVHAPHFPSELASQKTFLKMSYPKLPQRLFEQVIGFFDVIAQRHNSEAGVLIVWNSNTDQAEVVVPDQTGIVGTSVHGYSYPMEMKYEVPALPSHLTLLGDIHSHVDFEAYTSFTDERDEVHRHGIHLVVGRLFQEPPQFHCEVSVDGSRFKVRDLSLVVEGYERRRVLEVPDEWIARVSIEPWQYSSDQNNGQSLKVDTQGGETDAEPVEIVSSSSSTGVHSGSAKGLPPLHPNRYSTNR